MGQIIQPGESTKERVPVPAAGAVISSRKDVHIRSTALSGRKLNLKGEDRQRLIAENAYFRAEQRGFTPGRELEDWLAAEVEVDQLLDDEG